MQKASPPHQKQRKPGSQSILYLLHGFLFSAGSALTFYIISKAGSYTAPTDIILPTIFSIVVFLFFLLSGYLLIHDLKIAGLLATCFIQGLFYYWMIFLVIIGSLFLVLLAFFLIHKRTGFKIAHIVLNALSITIIGFYLLQFLILARDAPGISYQETIHPVQVESGSTASLETAPDIYYIILDSYGRADVLQDIYGMDNSGFVNALEQRGFVVSPDSQANYPNTLLSLSSALNLQYLDTMSAVMRDSRAWWPVVNTLKQSQVRQILDNLGYKTIFFASGWDYTEIRDGDYFISPFKSSLSNFQNSFLLATNLRIIGGLTPADFAWPSYQSHRQIILNSFDQLPEIASQPGPKFVFSHIIAAHPPYVFNRTGKPIDPAYPFSFLSPMDKAEYKSGYSEQLLFINQQILQTVDGILANSDTPPIIILQGDHGPSLLWEPGSTDPIFLYEHYSILNAVLLPGLDQVDIHGFISPVNTFRNILNLYFQADLELLDNKQFYSSDDIFYHFLDVTGQADLGKSMIH